MGYKKHTLRIVFLDRSPVGSIPAVTLVKPANASDGDVLMEMIPFWPVYLPPPIIVADMGYLQAERKKQLREQHRMALLTRVRVSMKPPQDFGLESDGCPTCFWGQRLIHDHFDWETQRHLYLKPEQGRECEFCPFLSNCSLEFWISPEIHETYLGAQPLHTTLAQRLLQFARPLVESGFSEDKNRFMLNVLFINSLTLAEFVSLLVDSAKLASALARLKSTHGKQIKKTTQNLFDQLNFPFFP